MRKTIVLVAASVSFVAASVNAQEPEPEPAPVEPAPEQPPPVVEEGVDAEPADAESAPAPVPRPESEAFERPPIEDRAGAAEPARPETDVAEQPTQVQTVPPPNQVSEPRATTYGGPTGDGDWLFDFHGFFRAPLRMGIGERQNPAEGQSGTTFHRPLIPDDQYLSWLYSGRGNDWAEMFFSVGNPTVSGTLAITGFQFTDAAWARPDAQFGIALGYLTVRPDLPYKNVRVEAVVGSHWNRYGQAGKYDSGKYDTFLFGRTHVMGYRLRGEIDVSDVTLWAEQGFGTKQPDPSVFNNARFTLLNHAHVGANYDIFKLGLHYLHSFTAEEAREGALPINGVPPDEQPDGSLTVIGPELRVDGGPAGELYVAYSRINANDAVTVSGAIEVIHSFGGGEFTQGITANYLDGGNPATTSAGNGSVDTLAGQYEFHLNRAVDSLAPQDLTVFLFGMLNRVQSEDPDLDGDDTSADSSITKVKWGFDLVGDLLPWLGAAFRFDRFQPNSEFPEQSYATIYPRLLFRTNFVTHELISLGYTRYFYNARSCPENDLTGLQCVQAPSAPVLPSGLGATTGNQAANTRGAPGFAGGPQLPDKQVITLEASMWW